MDCITCPHHSDWCIVCVASSCFVLKAVDLLKQWLLAPSSNCRHVWNSKHGGSHFSSENHTKILLQHALALQNYTIFWPLADNTNVANLASAARLGADVTSSGYAAAPADCVYVNSSE